MNVQGFLAKVAPVINSDGSIGRNSPTFSDVGAQRDAVWKMLLDFASSGDPDPSDVVSAMTYGFQHQAQDGSFSNNISDATTSLSASAFFLSGFARAYLGLSTSRLWTPASAGMQALLPQFTSAMTWLSGNAAALMASDTIAPNRLLFDAIAFYLGGLILNNPDLQATGKSFVTKAIGQQASDGSFIEYGGYDTSYQCTSMLNLGVLYAYARDPDLASAVQASLQAAFAWEAPKIASDGTVSIVGNTRTGSGQETGPSGQPKDVNYYEVALSLAYASVILSSGPAASSASAVIGLILRS